MSVLAIDLEVSHESTQELDCGHWLHFLGSCPATSQEKEDDPHSGVGVSLETLTLRDGLPKDGIATEFLVGDGIDLICLRHIEGKSRWLPNNAIEITLKITELDNTKRTETILLEGFEPKTLVLREDPARGRRELLRLIPVSKRIMEGIQIRNLP